MKLYRPWSGSIDHHPIGHLASNVRRQLCGLLRLFAGLFPIHVRFQALVEIVHTHASVDNSHNNENEGDDGEECQRPLRLEVFLIRVLVVNAVQLKQEICQRSKVEEL